MRKRFPEDEPHSAHIIHVQVCSADDLVWYIITDGGERLLEH